MQALSEQSVKHYDIAIVGGGIIGLSMANALSRLPGLNIVLIDQGAPRPLDLTHFDARVVALSKHSESFLRQLGVWEEVIATRACPYYDMHVWDGDGTADIHFDCAETNQDTLGHIIENSVLVDALLKELKGVDEIFNCSVDALAYHENKTLLTLSNGDSVSASMVLASDGANSPLRQMAGLETNEWDYGHTAIVCTVETEKPHQFTAWQRFSENGPLAFLPLTIDGGQANISSIVWSAEHDMAEHLMTLTDDQFAQTLAKTFEHRLGDVVSVDKRHAFPLRQRHAKRYVADRFALIGDAAHTIHPLAGQGANLGLYDVEVMAEEVGRALKRGIPLEDASILKRYQRRRQSHNLLAMSAMEGFKRMFGHRSLAVRWLRNEGLRRVSQLPILKKQFSLIASGRL